MGGFGFCGFDDDWYVVDEWGWGVGVCVVNDCDGVGVGVWIDCGEFVAASVAYGGVGVWCCGWRCVWGCFVCGLCVGVWVGVLWEWYWVSCVWVWGGLFGLGFDRDGRRRRDVVVYVGREGFVYDGWVWVCGCVWGMNVRVLMMVGCEIGEIDCCYCVLGGVLFVYGGRVLELRVSYVGFLYWFGCW